MILKGENELVRYMNTYCVCMKGQDKKDVFFFFPLNIIRCIVFPDFPHGHLSLAPVCHMALYLAINLHLTEFHSTSLYFILLHCTSLNFTVLCSIAHYFTSIHLTTQHCTQCTVFHSTKLYLPILNYILQHCIVLHCM